MKIVADENIPLVDTYFGQAGDLLLKPGRAITRDDVMDADILLVRSVTPVNQALLSGTAVRFVGSATTGADHLALKWLAQQGITVSVATGCNARAVVEYVISVIAVLQQQHVLTKHTPRAAVVGVGLIGSQVAKLLEELGFSVVLCDPLRAAREPDFPHTPLEHITDCDFITLHTPLTMEGAYPTYHMIASDFLLRQKPGTILLNTGRGATIHFSDLKRYGSQLHWCLDVWEQEPQIDCDVLKKAMIATPHIAGYSVESKYRGIAMIYADAIQKKVINESYNAKLTNIRHSVVFNQAVSDWRDVLLEVYNPSRTTDRMKTQVPHSRLAFDEMRKQFPPRHEWQFLDIHNAHLRESDQQWLAQYGMDFDSK